MKAILCIGYHRLLLPMDDATKVLKILGGALCVEDRIGERDTVKILNEELSLEMSVLPTKTKFINEESKPVTSPMEKVKTKAGKALPAPRQLRLC